jgi:hypothetical protein
MDGSGIDFIIMPLIIIPCVALWLGGMYYVAAHPRWRDAPSNPPPDIFDRDILVASHQLYVPAPRAETVISVAKETEGSEGNREAAAI